MANTQLVRRVFALTALIVLLCHTGHGQPSETAMEPAHEQANDGQVGTFRCLDGSKTILSTQVNDDYCDCADGSDEVNTSACVMLWSNHIVMKSATFKCVNTGSYDQSIPVHWVNDGLCDCCDGSDETRGLVECPNTCGEAARDRAMQIEKEEKMRLAAFAVKAKMLQKANSDRAKMKKDIPGLEKEIASFQNNIDKENKRLEPLQQKENEERESLRRQKEEWERKRAGRVAGCVGWRQTTQCDPKASRDVANDAPCLADIERGRSGFCLCGEKDESAWEEAELARQRKSPRYRDESQSKNTPSHRRDEAKQKVSADPNGNEASADSSEDFLSEDIDYNYDDDDEILDDGEEPLDEDAPSAAVLLNESAFVKNPTQYEFTCDHDLLQCAYVCQNGGAVGVHADGVPPPNAELYKLTAAEEVRQKIKELNEKKMEATDRLRSMQERLSHDTNTEDLLRTLEGESFTYDYQDYTYELQLFKGAWQNPRGGRDGTSIGKWGSFAENTYSSWAKDKYDYSQMLYDDGFRCFNGIIRSTEVHIVCGAESKLVHVEEPSMCKYKLIFETPAICEE